MKRSILPCVAGLLSLTCTAATITVTTTDNASTPDDGQTSLLEALQSVQAGDTIAFNIPGPGPHVIQTPLGGYPFITADNVTIDGYTQPGASPNTLGILEGNNARIQIVLDSSDPASQPGDPMNPALVARRSRRLLFPGFGDSENAILGVQGADNVRIRGLAFLSRYTPEETDDPSIYCVAFVNGTDGAPDPARNGHVSGCWFGLHPDGQTIKGGRASVATFRNGEVSAEGLVIGTNGDGVDDRAEFNVHVGMALTIHLEVKTSKVSGNYVNVFPDGVTLLDVNWLAHHIGATLNPDNPQPETAEFYENAHALRAVIGTDGDGVADADERNVIGGINYSECMEFWRMSQEVIVAGNYFGVGVDGKTAAKPSTNSLPDFLRISRSLRVGYLTNSSVRIGSNGDGVSDDIEANLIVGVPGDEFVRLSGGDAGDITEVAVRRNMMVGCGWQSVPLSETVLAGSYYLDVVQGGASPQPQLVSVVNGVVSGTFAAPNTANFPYHIIDLYQVDMQTLRRTAYGPAVAVHPHAWLGGFTDNGPGDLDPNPNAFAFDLNALGAPEGAYVAVTVTYSQEPNAQNAGRAVTTLMSNTLAERPTLFVRLIEGGQLEFAWLAMEGVFRLQTKTGLEPGFDWFDVIEPVSHNNGVNRATFLLDPFNTVQVFRLIANP